MIKRLCDICGKEKEIYFKCKIKHHTMHFESYGIFDDPMFFRSDICEDCLKRIIELMIDDEPARHGKWVSVAGKRARVCDCCGHEEPYKFAEDDADVYDFLPALRRWMRSSTTQR